MKIVTGSGPVTPEMICRIFDIVSRKLLEAVSNRQPIEIEAIAGIRESENSTTQLMDYEPDGSWTITIHGARRM